MGIDPVTHEPLHKETTKSDQNSQTHEAEQFPESEKDYQMQLPGSNVPVSLEENSYSSTDQNSSSDESNLQDSNLYENDPLISCLFRDETPQVEFPWEFPSPEENFNGFCASSWDENCPWLLDCQDFGIHDFGFDCFNDMGMNNAFNSLEMGNNQ